MTNSDGCGNLQVKVTLTVSPFRPSFPPQPSVFSQPPLALQPNFDAPGASSFLSMICCLLGSLCSLFRARVLCFHQLAASFRKIPGWGGYPDPVFGLSAGVDEDSRCRRCFYGMPGVEYPDPAFGLSAGAEAPGAAQPQDADLAHANTFGINTCKSVSKQTTLTPFRINTYRKPRGRGAVQAEISA